VAGDVTADGFNVASGAATVNSLVGTSPTTSTVGVAEGQTLGVDKNITNVNTLTVDGLATLHGGSTQGDADATSIIRNLVMNTTGGVPKGQLDITSGNVIVDYTDGTSPLVQIQDLIRSGMNRDLSGILRWTGNGITSSIAADPDVNTDMLLMAVGVRTAIDPGDGTFKMLPMTTVEGVSVPSSSVVFKFTYAGDADLDGKITAADYAVIDWYASHGVTGGATQGWMTGDFDLDGKITAADYALIDYAASHQSGLLGGAGGMSSMAVPEPATLALLALGAAAMITRRRRAGR
jgi:hypothetical protein